MNIAKSRQDLYNENYLMKETEEDTDEFERYLVFMDRIFIFYNGE